MSILEALWMGKISPIERPIDQGSPYHMALKWAIAVELPLRSTLDTQQRELLESYSDSETKMLRIAESEAFSSGFRLGVQLLLSALAKE